MSQYRLLVQNRNFRALWLSTVVSGFGDRIAGLALYLAVYALTGSPVELGILAAVQIAPAIVFGPIAGVLIDRYGRKRLLVLNDMLSALVAATLAVAATTGQIYILATLLACGRQLAGPARLALLPDLMPDDHLGSANALLTVTRNLVLAFGFFAGGALVAWQGPPAAFLVNAVTFAVSAVVLASRLRVPETVAASRREPAGVALAAAAQAGAPVDLAPESQGVVPVSVGGSRSSSRPRRGVGRRLREAARELREGLAAATSEPRLRFAFIFFAALTFVTAMQQPLFVVFVKEVLRGSDFVFGMIVAAAGIGGILGVLLGGARAGERWPLGTVVALTAVDGCLLMAFAATRTVWLATAILLVFGAIGTLAQVALATFLIRQTPEAIRGRVFGWLGAWVGPLSLVSVFLGPAAAAAFSVVPVLVAAGVFEVLVAIVGAIAIRRHRGLGLAHVGPGD